MDTKKISSKSYFNICSQTKVRTTHGITFPIGVTVALPVFLIPKTDAALSKETFFFELLWKEHVICIGVLTKQAVAREGDNFLSKNNLKEQHFRRI